MKAAVLRSPGAVESAPLAVEEVAAATLRPGELRLRVEACAVCRTDLQIVEGELAAHKLPLVPGHQVVGRAIEVGSAVDRGLLGSRLGVGWLGSSCGRCRQCLSGLENLCPDATFTGWDRDGGYAQEIVTPASYCFPISEELTAEQASPLLCGGIIGYRALRLAAPAGGCRLGLYGFGASALLVAQLARHFGHEIYVVSRDRHSRDRAAEFGAKWVGASGDRPPVPLDAAITFAPAGEVVVEALAALDRGGVCVVNAIHLDRVPQFDYSLLYWERRLMSVANFTREDSRELLRLAAEIPLRTVTKAFPLSDANQALLRLKSDQLAGAAVLLPD